ncbi:MFS transporter [Cryobacterium sp. TMT1-62]|uniref:MFS transporter n=1 Tax=unclassified Cryobacterium TaxID=2649013 RepID=UPI000CE49319|nr:MULTISPECIES: MFS transporter [unclassified Cryobacterium]TFB60285.1 MFS transporter [Cryobacterium sp. Hz7]TFC33802.1 MFS transporter [Cryobacterium sp. TMT2-14]TFC50792.1 MFS transporter [Cryobacterium sp. TMT2-17-1]TFC68553.1 MFS transporter [Cryobacterium sp. TMT2-4]TFD32889.1 MFS transporter [Cryobacterium sp. TMT1-62]
MALTTDRASAAKATAAKRHEERRVLAGTMVGTTIEWYDFFIYAQAAGLVLAGLYFAPLANDNAGLAQLVAWASLGISFLFRPLGAVVAGHLGDRLGRKAMLVLTLVIMGAATALIGLLPTFEQIGVWAPILLIVLRILQGFSAGGEWGGAALMSVEHAPVNKRGFFGAYPQIGVPTGLILATGVMLLVTSTMSEEAFLAWGWRIPFLVSVLLIVVGFIIRRSVDESPVFKEMQDRKKESAAPLRQLFRGHWRQVILTALIFIANNAAGYLLIAFFSSYATKPVEAGGLGMERSPVLLASTIAAAFWLASTMIGGILSDKIGRIRTFQFGYAWLFLWAIPMFLLIDTGEILWFTVALVVLASGLGFSYGPQAALYAEMFPAQVRYSGVSIGYAMGAILGGAFAPLIAQLLLDETAWSPSIGIYIMVLATISFVAVSVVKETRGVPLGISQHD